MSYILEALKKAEQQRDLGRVPGIGSVHEQARAGARARWLWLVSGVLALNAVVLLALFWADQRREPAVAATLVSPSLPQGSPAGQAAPAERAQPPVTEQTSVPESAAELPMVPYSLPGQNHAEPQSPATRVSGQDGAPMPVRSPPPAAPPEPSGKLPVWPQIPPFLLEQLGGGLRLDVHVFASQPAERFVLINLRKYHQGQELQEGPRLDEITSEGAILSFRGERFRLLAQQ